MTAIQQGPEKVAAAIVATLTSNLNASIDAIWTAWSGADPTGEDVPPNVHPTKIYRFSRRVVDLGNYPVIMVRPVGGRQTDNFMAVTPGSVGSDQWRWRLFVEVGFAGDDMYVMEAYVTRLVWAIRTCLLLHPLLDGSLGGYGGSLTLGEIGIGQAIENKGVLGANLQIWGGVEVFVEVEEIISN